MLTIRGGRIIQERGMTIILIDGVAQLGEFGIVTDELPGGKAAPTATGRITPSSAPGDPDVLELDVTAVGDATYLNFLVTIGRRSIAIPGAVGSFSLDIGRLSVPIIAQTIRLQGWDGATLGQIAEIAVTVDEPEVLDPLALVTAPILAVQGGGSAQDESVLLYTPGVYSRAATIVGTLEQSADGLSWSATGGSPTFPFTIPSGAAAGTRRYRISEDADDGVSSPIADTLSNVIGPVAGTALLPAPRPEQDEWSAIAVDMTTGYTVDFDLDDTLGATIVQWINLNPQASEAEIAAAWQPTVLQIGTGRWRITTTDTTPATLVRTYGVPFFNLRVRYRTATTDWSEPSPNRIAITLDAQTSTQFYNAVMRTPEEYAAGLLENCEANQWMRDMRTSPVDWRFGCMTQDVFGPWFTYNGWESVRPGRRRGYSGNQGQSIALSPTNVDILYAMIGTGTGGPNQGIIKSVDGGNTWTNDYTFPTSWNYVKNQAGGAFFWSKWLQYDPTTATATEANQRLYACVQTWTSATSYVGVQFIRKQPGASAWAVMGSMAAATCGKIYGIAPHPTRAGRVYAYCQLGLFRSDDYMATWARVSTPFNEEIRAIDIAPFSPASGAADDIIIGIDRRGVYRMTGNTSGTTGWSWTTLRADTACFRVDVCPANRSRQIMVRVGNVNPLITTNMWSSSSTVVVTPRVGRTTSEWQGAIRGGNDSTLGVTIVMWPNPADQNRVVAIGHAYGFISTDGGANFGPTFRGFSGLGGVNSAGNMAWDATNGRRAFVGVADSTAYETANGGRWWESRGISSANRALINDEPATTTALALEPLAGSDILLAAVGNRQGTDNPKILFRSTNGGDTYTAVDTAQTEAKRRILWHRQDTDYVFYNTRRSANKGVSFGSAGGFVADLAWDDCDIGWAVENGTTTLIRKCSNTRSAGTPAWVTEVTLPFQMVGDAGLLGTNFPAFACDPRGTDRFHTVNSAGQYTRWTKSAGVWSSLTPANGPVALSGQTDNYVKQIRVDPTHEEIVWAFTSDPGHPFIFLSTDSGVTWVDATANCPYHGFLGADISPRSGELWVHSFAGTRVRRPPAGFAYAETPLIVQEGYRILHQLPD